MADRPIIFAMANPDPEITAEDVAAVRTDAIMATGRSDYPNQINNVLGFPYIFRGALDVRARAINMEMKIAAAHALAALAREDVPDEVAVAYGARPKYGPDYIIPVPFDPRLISDIPPAVAKAAMDSNVARRPIADMDAYRQQLRSRLDPIAGVLQGVYERLRRRPRRVVFAEGEEEQVIRAAATFVHQGLGTALLVGRERRVRETAQALGVELGGNIEIINAAMSSRNATYAAYLYERLQRRGFLQRDCQRLVNQDRNHFASCMVALGDADAMVTGVTRNFSVALEDVRRCIDPEARPSRDGRVAGAGARPHRAGRRHRGDRNARRATTSPRSPSRRRGSRARSATSRGSLCSPSRHSAIPRANARSACRKRCGCSMSSASISNMTARWRPTWL